jgi:hypothetical protein
VSALDRLLALAREGFSRGWDGLDRREKYAEIAAEETELRSILEQTRSAIAGVFVGVEYGDLDPFHPDTDHPTRPNTTIECPGDDTCECACSAQLNALGKAGDRIADTVGDRKTLSQVIADQTEQRETAL